MSADGGVTSLTSKPVSKAKRDKLVELLIQGISVSEAAKEIGVSRRHAYRLISDPEARAAIQRAARESAQSAQLVLQRGAEEAARSLVAMGVGRMKATPARVAAARAVLDFVVERAATTMNVNASRMPAPEGMDAMAGGAVALLERAVADAEQGAADIDTVALEPAAPEAGSDSNALGGDPPEASGGRGQGVATWPPTGGQS